MDIWNLFKKISPADPTPVPEFIVAGLGNPGREYEGTRHNAGFRALDFLAERLGASVKESRFSALVGRAEISGHGVLLLKPQTYMNLSGRAVAEAANFYKIPPENIIVMCDDISFAPGHMRIRKKGSAGGHNGLKSIIESLGSDAFPRIKIGVGAKPSPDTDLASWVLGKLPEQDAKSLSEVFDRIVSAVALMTDGRADEAMSRYSG